LASFRRVEGEAEAAGLEEDDALRLGFQGLGKPRERGRSWRHVRARIDARRWDGLDAQGVRLTSRFHDVTPLVGEDWTRTFRNSIC